MTTPNSSGYKALVYLFLAGGNQSYNTVVPYTQSKYDEYKRSRGALALPRTTVSGEDIPEPYRTVYPTSGSMPGLVQLNGTADDGNQYAMHPECADIASLFNSGKVAIICNVGTLGEPTTLSSYQDRSVLLPAQIFSHYDQTLQWQIGTSGSTVGFGWGGKIADFYKQNAYTTELNMNMFPTTQSVFGAGIVTNSYSIGVGVPPDSYVSRIQPFYLSGSRSTINNTLKMMSLVDSNPLVKGYAEIKDSFAYKSAVLNRTLAGTGNLLKSSTTWTAGQTVVLGYNNSISPSSSNVENFRVSTSDTISAPTDPFGNNSVVWEIRPVLNASNTTIVGGITRISSSADGGFNTDIFPADHTKTYRSSHWIRRTGDADSFNITGSITLNDSGITPLTTGSINIAVSATTLTLASSASITNGSTITIIGAKSDGTDLTTVVSSGGGTTTLTLATAATASVTGVNVYGSTVTRLLTVSSMPTGKYVVERQYVFVGDTFIGYILDNGSQLGTPSDSSSKFRISLPSATMSASYLAGTTINIRCTGGALLYGPGPVGTESNIVDSFSGAQTQYPYWQSSHTYRPYALFSTAVFPNYSFAYPAQYTLLKDRWYLTVNHLHPSTFNLTLKNASTLSNIGLLPTSGAAYGDYYNVTFNSNTTRWVYTNASTTNDDNTTLTNNGYSYRGFTREGTHPNDGYYKRLADGSMEKVAGPGVTLKSTTLSSPGIDSLVSTIPVADVSIFSSTGGLIQIDNEVISYTGKNSTSLTGCVRGVGTNIAASHTTGATVKTLYEVVYMPTSYKMGLGTTAGQYRVYNYYDQSGQVDNWVSKYQVAVPRVDLITGSEPSISSLVLDGGSTSSEIVTNFQGSDSYGSIGPQLSQVFNLIKNASALTSLQDHRHIFYVQMTSFDNHDGEGEYHPRTMRALNANVKAFYDALVAAGLTNNVTISIQSEFARTLAPNGTGDGSDHAWGGYALVIGGAVNGYVSGVPGSGYYGTMPSLALGSANVNTISSVSLTSVNITDTSGSITYTSTKSLKSGDYITINGVGGLWSGTGSIDGYTAPTTYKAYVNGGITRLLTLDGLVITSTVGTILGTITAQNPNPLDVDGAGRLIPTTSTDQHAATLAKWFGINEVDLPTLFPNLTNFTSTTLGFMS